MLFDPRKYYKPFEYPEVCEFINLINKTYWLHTEVNFDSDHHEYKTALSELEKSAIKKSLLAISQIEVAVKRYWGNLYNFIPKPEFESLGSTFAESEVRHAEAYSRMLDVIGIENDEFEKFCELPVIKKRIEYLSSVNQSKIKDPYTFCTSLAIFTIAVENASLFSQFAVILSFQRFKGFLKNVADQVDWSSKDENVHANAGIWILKTVIKEYELDIEKLKTMIEAEIWSCYKSECDIIDYIFENGELEFLTKNELKNFIRFRINKATNEIGFGNILEKGENMMWFEEVVFGPKNKDFFIGIPSDYSVLDKSFSEEDLF